jgi:hypothetical protein
MAAQYIESGVVDLSLHRLAKQVKESAANSPENKFTVKEKGSDRFLMSVHSSFSVPEIRNWLGNQPGHYIEKLVEELPPQQGLLILPEEGLLIDPRNSLNLGMKVKPHWPFDTD